MSHGTHDFPDRAEIEHCLNESWPRDAATTPDRKPIPVTARVVWSITGEEWQEGNVTRWSGRCLFVQLERNRNRTAGVWLDVDDVKRR
jgi:hypothetical protein